MCIVLSNSTLQRTRRLVTRLAWATRAPGQLAAELGRSGRFIELEFQDGQEVMKKSQIDLSHLSNEELLNEAKSNKPSPLFDAFFIGFLIGIIIFGVAASAFGFFLLLPLFLIYIMLKKPKRHEALQRELKKRGL